MNTPSTPHTPIAPITTADPVAPALESLASARWMRDPDWSSFKEKLVNVPKPRFQFARRRPILFAVLAATGLSAAAAAMVEVYQHYHFTGVATLDDGRTIQIEGDMVLDGQAWTATTTTDAQNVTSGGEMIVTTPDGGEAHIIFEPANGAKPAQDGTSQQNETTKTPAKPVAPK